ncbi:TraI domain-containing protein [Serratia oryzae]|uniref:TraI domain-containing protein n=1 Tax=Serratia oryzae TaxID=2034155 RepID=UPI0012E160EB|nr:TraI domain-containing protein [Serratia oryzae]
MLRLKLRSLFRPVVSSPVDSTLTVPSGYLLPLSASSLLSDARRQQWLQMLWDYSSLPKDLYQQYYLQPLERCVTLIQQFPATENGHHAYLGGMVDHLLETVAYAARLSKNYLLPVGAPPEEQASQGAAWNAVIVYAAMLQALDGLCHIEVELESGRHWLPLDTEPEEPYRFRFSPVTDALQLQSLSAMRAWKIIPNNALLWLSTWPEVLTTLSLYLTGFRHESGIINTIVAEAIRTSVAKTTPTVLTAPQVTTGQETMLPNVTTHPECSLLQAPSIEPVEHLTAVNLASSLDSAVSDNTPCDAGAEPVVQREDATGDLLAVMGLSAASEPDGEGGPMETKAEQGIYSAPQDIGERFWQWLSDGCITDTFSVNTANSRIHIFSGYVFIRAPNIFHQFLLENQEYSEDKTGLQNAFERLGRHRLNKGVMYTCHIYQNKAREGRFQKVAGYLIAAKKLYKDHDIPADNPFLVIKS